MEIDNSYVVRGHLSDFETTTSHLVRPGHMRALLNFAALFHEEIYLTDTALADSQLILDSFLDGAEGGLFQQIIGLMKAGVLKALLRDKVVVSGELRSGSLPTLEQIFEGWLYRDRKIWRGQSGFTSKMTARSRTGYLREVQEFLDTNANAIHRYDPDLPKAAFRRRILDQLDTPSASLARAVGHLPKELRRRYLKATKDAWFTNAELWRILREDAQHESVIILHAHINQQCYADLTDSGQSTSDSGDLSLASFNLELQGRKPLVSSEIHATLHPPRNFDELLESAPVRFESLGIEMLEKLTVSEVIALRRYAGPMFALTRLIVETPAELDALRIRYLKEIEKYWSRVVESFERASKEKLFQPRRTALFVEQSLLPLERFRQEYGSGIFAILWRTTFAKAAALSSVVGPVASHYLGALFLQERTPDNLSLRAAMPPPEWYPPVEWESSGVLRLSSARAPTTSNRGPESQGGAGTGSS